MKKYILNVVFIGITSLFGQKTNLVYDLNVLGHTVGEFNVSRQIQGGQTIYTSILESEVHLLVTTVKVKIHQKVTYEGNLMINSLNEVWRDDKVYDHTEVKREGNDYKIYKPNELTSLSRGISFSSIRLYFQKPQSMKEIFFEADAVFKSIVPSENNDYWAIEHGKYLNNYHYNNEGKMEKAVIDSGFYNVTLLLRK